MCYGISDDKALATARAGLSPSRRAMLRGAAAGALGASALAAGVATAPAASAAPRRGGGRLRVPRDRISIQLYTVRDALTGEPGFDDSLRHIAGAGYPRVEQALGFFGRTAKELRAFYRQLGIRATSSHNDISPDEEELKTKLKDARTLGQSFINVPWLSSEDADDWRRWAEQMNHEAAKARRYGLRYGYHNHAHEFTTDLGGGLTPWSILTSELDPRLVHLEIDIYWAVTAAIESGDGVDDPERYTLDVIRSAPQRTLQYHVKDRDPETGDMADPGTGMIDFPRIFRAHPVREYIVENDTPDVTPLHTADVGYAYLRDLSC
ncbi:sugar phosphate isomerase/epimerase family protein [Streptomyces profundus]|uniref:sugar phosphate isomerase/epimerase family protein n=1 Tax=Streptomyces profundus TaxID=2867410 RepID=UPI001D16E275|nr:sugar phosphate isomerase/epimerase [Streptomyces sp. MA3_2.13]UED87353.1 sugar phosphate isomerase/epimerase [Streptomyces sp. MA3_2.13]